MLPREKNGVVDANLKVYGTKNLRVADLSIVPLHIAAHTQGEKDFLVTLNLLKPSIIIATAYTIGEQGKYCIHRWGNKALHSLF